MTIYTAKFLHRRRLGRGNVQGRHARPGACRWPGRYDEHTEDLMFQSYESGMPVNEIEITGPDGSEVAVWRTTICGSGWQPAETADAPRDHR